MVSGGFFHALRLVFYERRAGCSRAGGAGVLNSQFARLFFRYVFKPLAFAAVCLHLSSEHGERFEKMLTLGRVPGGEHPTELGGGAGRWSRRCCTAADHAGRGLHGTFGDDCPGRVQIVQGCWSGGPAALCVDELLRFRAGQKRSTVVVKAVLGFFWFYRGLHHALRDQPADRAADQSDQTFSVVTVSHKMILPTAPYIAGRCGGWGLSLTGRDLRRV